MPDTDKILEAEQSIQNIAAELRRMRDAANLLQGAQETTDSVLRAAEKVIKNTDEFTVSCGEIIRKLSAADLNKRLDNILGRIDHIFGLVDELAEKTSLAITKAESRIAALENTLQEAAKRAWEHRTMSDELAEKTSLAITKAESRIAALENTLQEAAKRAWKHRTMSIVLIILTLVTSLSVLAITLLRGIGG